MLLHARDERGAVEKRRRGRACVGRKPTRDLHAPEHPRDEPLSRAGSSLEGGAERGGSRWLRRRRRASSATRRGRRRSAGVGLDARTRAATTARTARGRASSRVPSESALALASDGRDGVGVVRMGEDRAARDEHAGARCGRLRGRVSRDAAVDLEVDRAARRDQSSARMARTFGSTSGMNACPPKPGLTLMTRTRSATSSAYSDRALRASTG